MSAHNNSASPPQAAWPYARITSLALGLTLLSSCGTAATAQPAAPPQATPTIAPFFVRTTPEPIMTLAPSAAAPTARPRPTTAVEPTAEGATPAGTPAATPAGTPAVTPVARSREGLQEVTVYGNDLATGWALDNSQSVRFAPASGADRYQSGATLGVTPQVAFAPLYFTLRPQPSQSFPRANVAAVTFLVSGGARELPTDALGVSVIGSNQQTFWRAGDESVTVSGRVTDPNAPLFPETRLYFMGLNRPIPAREWVEVTLWLDDLQAEPDYRYVTGLVFKNDSAYVLPYYIAELRLLVKRPANG